MDFMILSFAFVGAVLSVYGFCRFIGLCENVGRILRVLEERENKKK